MPLSIGFEQTARLVDGDVLADAGDDVLQRPPLGRVIEHVVDGNQRDARLGGEPGEAGQPAMVVAAIEHGGGEPDGARRGLFQPLQQRVQYAGIDALRHDDEIEPIDVLHEIVEEEEALAFVGAALADAEQTGEAAPGCTILRVGENVGRGVGEHEARADDELYADLLCLRVSSHHPGQGIAIGNAETGKLKLLGAGDQFLRVRRAAQEGEIGGDGKLGERCHSLTTLL
jgi:hypothetical protein